MLPLKRRTQFTPPPTALEAQLVPVISTMAGSLAVLAPTIATEPLMPPFGLMVFLGWRLLRGNIWPLWMGLPLGLWDDLFSGQPIGTAMCGWTAIMLVLDNLDRRTPFRDHRQDWVLAGLLMGGYLLFALVIARITGGIHRRWPSCRKSCSPPCCFRWLHGCARRSTAGGVRARRASMKLDRLLGKRSLSEAQVQMSFTRRGFVLGAAQVGLCGVLAGRMAWISVVDNEKYKLLAESNRVNLSLIPPRRGWIIDRNGKPLALNRTIFRVDIIPDRMIDREATLDELQQILGFDADERQRISDDIKEGSGFQPVQVAENLSWEHYAALSCARPS